MRGERPVPDLLVLPQGRCGPVWAPLSPGPGSSRRVAAGPSRAGAERRDCADRAVPSPFSLPTPPLPQGVARPTK